MLQNSSEFNSVGAGYPGVGGFGGFGGIGLVGLIGLLGRRGLGGDGDDNCAREAAILAAISNSKDATVAEGRGLASAICDSEKTNLQQFYAAAIQASNNTQAIKDQNTAFAIVNDKRFDDLAAAGVAQTAAILAKINQTEIDALRDQLNEQRHHGRSKEIEITMIQNQNQQQQQFQVLNNEFDKRFNALFSQVAKAGQDIIAVGSVLTGTTQTANPVNVKS